MLMLLVPQVIHLITENYSYDEVAAAKEFYDSKVYSLLQKGIHDFSQELYAYVKLMTKPYLSAVLL